MSTIEPADSKGYDRQVCDHDICHQRKYTYRVEPYFSEKKMYISPDNNRCIQIFVNFPELKDA